MSRVLDDLGNLHIVTGRITVTSNSWTLASNDGSASLTDIGAGNVSVTFGQAFLSAPRVVCQTLKGTHEADVFYDCVVETTSTTGFEIVFHHDTAGTNTTADPDDGNGCDFIAIGVRNN